MVDETSVQCQKPSDQKTQQKQQNGQIQSLVPYSIFHSEEIMNDINEGFQRIFPFLLVLLNSSHIPTEHISKVGIAVNSENI